MKFSKTERHEERHQLNFLLSLVFAKSYSAMAPFAFCQPLACLGAFAVSHLLQQSIS
jgi:hypothetical protein